MKTRLWNSLPLRWRDLWLGRQERERRALRLLAVVVGAGLAVQLLWSMETQRRSLREQLPKLAAQAETMVAVRAEWQALTASGAGASAPDVSLLRESLTQRLPQLGPGISAQWADDGSLKLSGITQFGEWIQWLAAVQKSERMFVVSTEMHADPAGIRIEAVLAPAR